MKLSRIIFMGTPEFAVPSLKKLVEQNYKPLLCITQPDKPKGRKKKLLPTEVKIKAIKHNIPILQPININDEDVINEISKYNPELIITVAYGGYIGKKLRKMPKFGIINLHPSLLPKYRGSSPINYPLFNGDEYTGNTIFKIVSKMDAGPIIYQSKIKIEKDDNYTKLSSKLAKFGAKEIITVIKMFEEDKADFIKQDETSVSYTQKIEKKDLYLDWNMPAKRINNKVRGLAEKPAVSTSYKNKQLKIIETEILESKSSKKPGTVVNIEKKIGIVVATQDFDILIKKVQPAGKKIMDAYAFYLGARIMPNEILG